MILDDCFEKSVYGHSFSRIPLEFCSLGRGKTPLLFSASFAGEQATGALLNFFIKELSLKTEELSFFLSLRRILFLQSPNPDALLIRSSAFTGEHPLYERVTKAAQGKSLISWEANGRGIAVSRNFNYRFSKGMYRSAPKDSPPAFSGSYPESEPESAGFAALVRRIHPRLFLHLTKGEGISLPPQKEEPFLSALCLSHSFLPLVPFDFSGTPEGWAADEQQVACLRIGLSGDRLEHGALPKTYELLRPLLFALFHY